MLLRRAVVLAALVLAGCVTAPKTAATPPEFLPIWLLFDMKQEAAGQYAWKPISTAAITQQACITLVREHTKRGALAPIGLVGWYPLPGEPGHWVGCLPVGLDPHAPR